MKPILKLIFGNGTRSVQAINLSANVVWFVLLTLPLFNVISVGIPDELYNQMYYPHILTGLAVLFAIIGFSSEKDKDSYLK